MTSLRACGSVLLAGMFAACGGAGSTGSLAGADGGDATGGDGGPSAQGGGDGATSQNGPDASDGALSTPDSGDAGDGAPGSEAGGSEAGDAQSDVAPPPCPDVHGAYSITPVEGQGCGGSFSASAPQCIRQGQSSACGITFQSTVSGGANKAINGDASLQSDGTFSGAALTEGALGRTGCTGTWSAGTSTLTVDCGGTGSSQACVLSLVRTAATCP
jgi:hypothetical protein